MKFHEAMKLLEQACKVRVKIWHDKNRFIQLNDEKMPVDENGNITHIHPFYINKEWELYEEPSKNYSLIEILNVIKNRSCKRKIRRKVWNLDAHLTILADGSIEKNWYDDSDFLPLDLEDLLANDWIETKE